jgi:hypothetical protein
VAYNNLAFQNVKSGKQCEGAVALLVVGWRPANLAFVRIKQRLSILAPFTCRPRQEFPKLICKEAETPVNRTVQRSRAK